MNSEYPALDLPFIRQQLANSPIGQSVVYHTTIASTMPVAAELAQDPTIPSGLIVVAEEQTSGRGRRGRSWQAPYASALLVSVLLKPPHCRLPPATLTMVAGNALFSAITAVVPEVESELYFKWPNDLVLGRDPASARKVAGILAESSFDAEGSIRQSIFGIGVNVNQRAGDLPRIAPPTPRPTSLRLACNRLIDRGALLVQLCRQLTQELARPPADSYRRWKSHLSTLGHIVAIYPNGPQHASSLIGQAIDAREDGALVVVDETGVQQSFYAADVSVRVTPP